MENIIKKNQEQLKLLTNELNQFTIQKSELDYSKTQLELIASQLWNIAKKLEVLARLDKVLEKADKDFKIYKSLDENPYVELDKPSSKSFPKRRMFTPEQIRWIRNSDLSLMKLAHKFNCSLGTITQIKNRTSYKNIW